MSDHTVARYSTRSAFVGAGRRENGGLVRRLEVLERAEAYSLARLEVQAQVDAARVHAISFVGQQAMQAAALVSQVEQQLGTICPLAVSRLQAIGDMTAFAIVQEVSDVRRRLR